MVKRIMLRLQSKSLVFVPLTAVQNSGAVNKSFFSRTFEFRFNASFFFSFINSYQNCFMMQIVMISVL